MIIRWHKHQDFFIVRLYQDLMGDWVLTESWGNSVNDQGAFNHTVYHCYHEARNHLRDIGKKQKNSGYKKTVSKEQQIELDYGSPADETLATCSTTTPITQIPLFRSNP